MNARQRKVKERMEEIAEEFGAEVVAVTMRGSGHYGVEFRLGDETMKAIVPFSPSDHRSELNGRAYIRRSLRALEEKCGAKRGAAK